VLVARFSALGDVAMTVPVLYSAARCYPDVEFTFVTRASMASIFVDAPRNLNVIGLVIAALDGGMSKAAVCRNFSVKRTTLIETLARVGWTDSSRASSR